MRAFYEQTLWIAQDFLLMHPDLHHRLLGRCVLPNACRGEYQQHRGRIADLHRGQRPALADVFAQLRNGAFRALGQPLRCRTEGSNIYRPLHCERRRRHENGDRFPHLTSAAAQHSVALSWTASSASNPVSYKMYRSTATGASDGLLASAVSGTAYTNRTVQPGTVYYYAVTTVNSAGQESAFSNHIRVTVP